MATTLLGWTEERFWKSTPRVLTAQWDKHVAYHNPKQQESIAYIDQLPFM